MPGIALDARVLTPGFCPSGVTDSVCVWARMCWGPGEVGSEPVTMKFLKNCFLRVVLELVTGQFVGWSTAGVGMASWRKCQWVLRTLGRAGWGEWRLLVVEKLKVVMKAWGCANRS